MKKNKKLNTLFFSFSFILIVATTLLGLVGFLLTKENPNGDNPLINLHAQLSILTIIPLLLTLLYLLKIVSPQLSPETSRSYALSVYAAILWLVIATLSGLATRMEFFPAFFHKITVWPFIFYFIWISYKGLIKK